MVPFLLTFPIWYWLNVRSRNIRIRMRLRAVCMMGGPNIADILNLWIHEYGHPPKYGLSRLYLYRATYPARLSPIICLSKYRFKETFQCCSEFSFFCRIHNLYTSFQNYSQSLEGGCGRGGGQGGRKCGFYFSWVQLARGGTCNPLADGLPFFLPRQLSYANKTTHWSQGLLTISTRQKNFFQ